MSTSNAPVEGELASSSKTVAFAPDVKEADASKAEKSTKPHPRLYNHMIFGWKITKQMADFFSDTQLHFPPLAPNASESDINLRYMCIADGFSPKCARTFPIPIRRCTLGSSKQDGSDMSPVLVLADNEDSNPAYRIPPSAETISRLKEYVGAKAKPKWFYFYA